MTDLQMVRIVLMSKCHMLEVENMTVKEVKEKYKFYHIFINGDELYHKDNSVNNREVKSIIEKEYFFGSKAVYVTIQKKKWIFHQKIGGKKDV